LSDKKYEQYCDTLLVSVQKGVFGLVSLV